MTHGARSREERREERIVRRELRVHARVERVVTVGRLAAVDHDADDDGLAGVVHEERAAAGAAARIRWRAQGHSWKMAAITSIVTSG